MTPRTKTGAVLVDNPGGTRETRVWAIRAIEDEMLDKVAAAVERSTIYRYILPADDESTPTRARRPFDMFKRDDVLAAIEDIRKEASDGR